MGNLENVGVNSGGLKRLKNRTENGRVYLAKFKAQICLPARVQQANLSVQASVVKLLRDDG